MSFNPGAHYQISLNGNVISHTFIDHSNTDDIKDRIGAVTLARKLHRNDKVWLEAVLVPWYFYGGDASTLTITKIK